MWQRCLLTTSLVVLAGCASGNPFSRLSRRTSDTPPPLYAADGEPEQTSRKPLLANLKREDSAISETLKSAEQAEDSGRLAEARGLYERVLTYKPDHPRAHHRLATIADREARFGDAERHYQSALKSNPKNSDILSDMGYSYQLQGRYAESEQRLSAALRINPKHRQALFNLGNLYAMHGRDEDALSLYRKAGSESEAQAALVQAKRSEPAVQMASHSRQAAGPVSPASPEKRTDSGKKYPNAATRKLAEEMERRRAAYQQNEMARGRPGSSSSTDMAGHGANPSNTTRYSSEEMRARFEQIDQQFDGVNANPPPIMVGPPGSQPGVPGAGQFASSAQSPANQTAESMQGASLAGYGVSPQGGAPAGWQDTPDAIGQSQPHATAFAPAPQGAAANAPIAMDQGAAMAPNPAWSNLPSATPNWSQHAAGPTGQMSGQPVMSNGNGFVTHAIPTGTMMPQAPPPATHRAAQLGLGAGQGSLSFDDGADSTMAAPPSQGLSSGGGNPNMVNSAGFSTVPAANGMAPAGSPAETELRALQQQMQQLQQRQWQLQQRLQAPPAPQIRPGAQ